MARQLSSITTNPDRDYIEIDGKNYGVITSNELELKHLLTLQKIQRAMRDGVDEESEEGMAQLSRALNAMTRIILVDAPDEVHAKLKDMHRMEIVRVFTAAGQSTRESQTETSTEESPDSPVSTEAAQESGLMSSSTTP